MQKSRRRWRKIKTSLLLKKKKVTVKELAGTLYVSEPSVRRDLARLENQNLIKRIHGGAMIEETAISKNKIPFKVRELEESSAKIIIAKEAVKLAKKLLEEAGA